ncbi:MAG: hypothetical protein RQ833_02205 [Sphingomonadaceae bacterium]|nr:hypothetical protein [Sphingomonadaceae bacterium]
MGLGRDFEPIGRFGNLLALRWPAYAKDRDTNTTVGRSVTFDGSTICVSEEHDGFRC